MINEEEKFEELLCDWELARQEGRELSAEELCASAPHLLDRVRKGIEQLKATSWMLDDEAKYVPSTDVIPDADRHQHETALPESDVTIAVFVQAASDSGILSESNIEELNRYAGDHDWPSATTFATKLVENEILTGYQARVILEKGNSPLLLDRYIILDTIGSGGMGLVFKALHRSMERIVALKVLPRFAVNSAEKVSRFQREIKATAKISHPNVVAAFDAHESNGTFFLVMEFVDGVNLMEHVERHGPMSVGDAASIIAQVSAGLEEAHRNRIIHRDIKPTNIMLSSNGVAKLLDLGLARTKELAKETTSNELTRDGLAMGTVDYMSPEQALVSKEADVQSDLYSLGCTLYFLLVGQPPLVRSTTVKTIIAHREDEPPSLREARADVPASLESVFLKMVAKTPSERYGSTSELRRELLDCGVVQDSVVRPVPATEASFKEQSTRVKDRDYELKRRVSSWWIWLPVAALLIAALFGGLLISSNLTTEPLANTASQRDIAKLVLAGEGTVEIETELGIQTLLSLDELPESDFEILALEIYGCDEPLSLKPIGQLKQLYSLGIYGFRDFDLRDLRGMPDLIDLTVSGESVNDQELVGVEDLRHLESLDLTDSAVTDESLSRVLKMNRLRDLYLGDNEFTGAGLRSLNSMSQLETIGLDSTLITGEDLEFLPRKLSRLFAVDCRLGDQDVAAICKFEYIECLDLRETEITGKGIEKLSAIGNLKELYVDGDVVSAANLAELSKLANLTTLSLEGLDVTQECLEAILEMQQLESIFLDGSNLNDAQLLELAKLKNLQSLSIDQTKTSDKGIDRFLDVQPECTIFNEFE